jgi:hypothetical protein
MTVFETSTARGVFTLKWHRTTFSKLFWILWSQNIDIPTTFENIKHNPAATFGDRENTAARRPYLSLLPLAINVSRRRMFASRAGCLRAHWQRA